MRVETFRAVRVLRGLTQKEFASMIGVSHALVTFIEKGEKRLTEKTANKVRQVFGQEYVAKVNQFISETTN